MRQETGPSSKMRRQRMHPNCKSNYDSLPLSSKRQIPILLLVVGAVAIAATLTLFPVKENSTENYHRELGQHHGEQLNVDDDDYNKDGICRQYLMAFLNGTTDAHDECEGLENAYEAADCKYTSDRRLSFLSFDFSDDSDDADDNTNTTDDEVTAIDDYFENFQCCSWIHTYYIQKCRNNEISPYALLFLTVVLVLCGVVRNILRIFDVKWFPEAAGCILVGAVAGLFLHLILPDGYKIDDVYFDKDFFLQILLPPIVFEAALCINKAALRRHLFPVLVLAVIGTFLSSGFAGAIVYGITYASSGVTSIPLLESLLYGTLVATVDPVATLATFDSLGVSHTESLYILVFGESLLNDGVTIVLFQTIVTHLDKHLEIDSSVVWEAVSNFFIVIFGSMGIGLGSTFVFTIYHWAFMGKQVPVVEVAIFFVSAFIPFYLTEGIGWSGIVAILTAGFAMDIFIVGDRHYGENESEPTTEMQSAENFALLDSEERLDSNGIVQGAGHEVPSRPAAQGFCRMMPSCSLLQNIFSGRGYLSASSKSHIDFVAKVVSSLMEMAIFAYLGVFLFSTKVHTDVALDWTAIFAAIASRCVMIIILCMAINMITCLGIGKCFRCLFCCSPWTKRESVVGSTSSTPPAMEKQYIDNWTQIILIFSGMRGAVSLALVESIPVYNAVTKRGSEHKSELKSMTTSTIIFTVFAFGCLTYHLLKKQQQILARNTVTRSTRIASQAEEPLIADADSSLHPSASLDEHLVT